MQLYQIVASDAVKNETSQDVEFENSEMFASVPDRDNIRVLLRVHDKSIVLNAIDRASQSGKVYFDVVHKDVLRELSDRAPRFTHCTGGVSAIEIDANGNYARCLRYTPLQRFMGNILVDGKVNLIDLEKEAECNLPCRLRMCFAKNVIRTTSKEALVQEVNKRGIRGDYGDYEGRVGVPDAKIFVRWKITETCNYRCSYCSAWKTVNKKLPEVEAHEVMNIAEKLVAQFDGISLRITGGEPSTVRTYVGLMRFLNKHLDRFADVEIRTNFSFPEKQEQIFALDWRGKLNYHIGAHIYDVNFRPWTWIDLLRNVQGIRYVVKFVRTVKNEKYVDAFQRYLEMNGIPAKRIIVISDVRSTAGDENSRVPPAYDELVARGIL